MHTLQGYFRRETVRPLLITTLVMAMLALLTQSLSSLDLLLDGKASFFAYLKIILLTLPQLVSIVLPFAVFIAVVYAVHRLHTDNEIMVGFASGMSRWAVISPLLRLSILIMLANLILTLWAQPFAYRAMRETVYQIRSDLAAAIIRPGKFVSPADNLTIFTRKIDQGVLKDVFIHDGRNHAHPTTYMAQTGQFTTIGNNPALALTNATRQTFDKSGDMELLKFSSTIFELSGVIEPQGALFYKLSDRFLGGLLHPDMTNFWERKNTNAMVAEAHYRITSPLYSVLMMLMALTALLGGDFNRLGYARRIAGMAALALLARLIGFTIQAAAVENTIFNLFQYILPLAGSGLCLWVLLRKPRIPATKESA